MEPSLVTCDTLSLCSNLSTHWYSICYKFEFLSMHKIYIYFFYKFFFIHTFPLVYRTDRMCTNYIILVVLIFRPTSVQTNKIKSAYKAYGP